MTTSTDHPSVVDMLDGGLTLAGGLVAWLMPFFLLSAPAIFPLLVFGGVVAAALALVAGLAGAILGAPVLLVYAVRRRRARTA
jgi:hypothetical protein